MQDERDMALTTFLKELTKLVVLASKLLKEAATKKGITP